MADYIKVRRRKDASLDTMWWRRPSTEGLGHSSRLVHTFE